MATSTEKINYSFFLIFIPVILKALTPFLLKEASIQMPKFTFFSVITSYLYWTSFILFFFMALFWQIVLRKFPLSFVYPFMGLSYVFLLIIGFFYFHEKITTFNIIGSAFIVLGTVVLAKNKGKDE